jgi:hypothetical protein
MSRVPFVRCASDIVEAHSSALMIIPRAIREKRKRLATPPPFQNEEIEKSKTERNKENSSSLFYAAATRWMEAKPSKILEFDMPPSIRRAEAISS